VEGIRVHGPAGGYSVLVLSGDATSPEVEAVVARLNESGLQTVVPEDISALSVDKIVSLTEQLKLRWLTLVGVGAGADLAWQAAAQQGYRFSSLVIAELPHPAVSGSDPACAAIQIPTTMLLNKSQAADVGLSTGRKVWADYRYVTVGGTSVLKAPAEFASEVVLRTSTW
jgi:pimeloyl-ACP methyl ester carboxylesterase